MTHALIYCRVSDERQRGNTSIADQEALARSWCAARNYAVAAVYHDEAVSARVRDGLTESFDSRPGWSRLLEHVRQNPPSHGGPAVVVFKNYRRFSRDTAAAYAMIRQLHTYGVEVQAIEQPIDWDVPEQKLLVGIYLSEGEVDNDRRAMATRRGMVAALASGRFIHAPPAGYRATHSGGKRTGIEADPALAPLVRDAFMSAADSATPLDRARQRLNAAAGRRMFKSKTRFKDALRNRVYVGEVHVPEADGHPARWVEGQHEGIIPPGLFAQVQARLERMDAKRRPGGGRKKKVNPNLPLRGIIRCPETDTPLTGSGAQNKLRKRFWYYHGQGRGAFRVRAEEAHETLYEYLAGYRIRGEVLDLVDGALRNARELDETRRREERRELQAEIAMCDEKLLAADVAAVDGRIAPASHARITTAYTQRKNRATARLIALNDRPAFEPKVLESGVEVLSDLAGWWERSNAPKKHALGCSIFPAGFAVREGHLLNTSPGPVFGLLTAVFDAQGPKTEEPRSSEEDRGSVWRPGRDCDRTPIASWGASERILAAIVDLSRVREMGL